MDYKAENGTLTVYLEGRIDTNNAPKVEEEIGKILEDEKAKDLVIDAGKLEYISSAGLRVLMKFRKQMGKPLDILDVSREVYEIFETTGFTDLFNVKKKLRELSIDGLEKIGQGATASVYRIDRETIVKVFNENVYMDMITNENERSKAAFVAGIPTAISFDLVKVGNCYGTVFELLDAVDLLEVWEQDKEHIREHAARFGRENRKLHDVEVEPEKFPDTRTRMITGVQRLVGLVCTQEEADTLRKLFEIIPEQKTFIHGDCHPGNIMVQNDEYVFIDLSSGGIGHPIFDLCSMCTIYGLPTLGDEASYEASKQKNIYLRSFTLEDAKVIWGTFLRSYFDTDDVEFIKKASMQVMAYSAARLLFVSYAIPGLVPEEKLQAMKQFALGYCANMEPLCF